MNTCLMPCFILIFLNLKEAISLVTATGKKLALIEYML
jgi:hypothetical protein